MEILHPKLRSARAEHDEIVRRVQEARQGRKLAFTELPAEETGRAAALAEELRTLGASLYADADRSVALSLRAYWINALYRANWYRAKGVEPPTPEIAPFDPEGGPLLTDAQFPWTRWDLPETHADAEVLWGRLSGEALARLRARRVVCVHGAAGSGRSHLIDFGLRPALQREAPERRLDAVKIGEALREGPRADDDRQLLSALTPPVPPTDETALVQEPGLLAAQLDATGQRHVVIVSDLHEIFTFAADPYDRQPSRGQAAFIEALRRVAQSPREHWLVIEVQTEFLGRLREFGDFYAMLEASTGAEARPGLVIVALESAELTRFVAEPAKRVGLLFEAGLLDRIIVEHQGDPAALTVLLFTLRRLWSDMLAHPCRRNMITWENYLRVGCGRDVFEIAADEATEAVVATKPGPEAGGEAVEEEQREALAAIRLVFMALVRVAPGSAWSLAAMPREKIEALLAGAGHPPERIGRVFAEFTRVGLLVEKPVPAGGGVTMRIAHDLLVTRWPRLVQWVEEKRDERRLYWRLRADALEWNRLRQSNLAPGTREWSKRAIDACRRWHLRRSRLWRGSKLREAETYEVSPREAEFLRASRVAWMLSLLLTAMAIASVPIFAIGNLLWQTAQQRTRTMALYLDRGVGLVEEGDPGLASLWLAGARKMEREAPIHRVLQWLPESWQMGSARAREQAQAVSIGMAFNQLPHLAALHRLPDGLTSARISPDGKWALLGCRRAGKVPGQVLLWDMAGPPQTLIDQAQGVSIQRVVMAEIVGDAARGLPTETLCAAGGTVGEDDRGIVFLWAIRSGTAAGAVPAPRAVWRREFPVRVQDLAFSPQPNKEGAVSLAVATGDEGKVPVEGACHLFTIAHARGAWTLDAIANARAVPPPPAPAATGAAVALPALRVAFSPAGRLAVAYGKPSERVAVFDATSGQTRSVGENLLPAQDLVFSKQHELLAVASSRSDFSAGSVRLFSHDEETASWRESRDGELQLRAGVLRVAFSPDGRSLLASAANGVLGLWTVDCRGGARLQREVTEGGWPYTVAWSPDSAWFATGNRDRKARVWDAATGRPALPPLYHSRTVNDVTFSPDGLHLLAITVETARLWETAPRRNSLLPVRSDESAAQVALSTDGRWSLVVTARSGRSRDGMRSTELALWDSGALLPTYRKAGLPTLARVALSPDGSLVATLTEEQDGARDLRIWQPGGDDTKAGQPIKVPAGADFLRILPGTPARLVVAGRLPAPDAVAAPGPNDPPAVASAPARETEPVGFLQFYELPGAAKPREIRMPFRIRTLTATEDGKWVAVGGDAGASLRGGKVALLALTPSGYELQCEPTDLHDEAVTTLAFFPHKIDAGRPHSLLSGSVDDRVHLTSLVEGRPTNAFPIHLEKRTSEGTHKHTADVTSVGFSPDGARAVSTGYDSDAILWDLRRDGLDRCAVLNHRGVVVEHAFSPDGQWLATGGEDGVRLWCPEKRDRLQQGELIAVLPHRHPVAAIVFADENDLRTLAHERVTSSSGGRAVEVRQWWLQEETTPPKTIAREAELIAGRQLSGGDPVNLLKRIWHRLAGRKREEIGLVNLPAAELEERWIESPRKTQESRTALLDASRAAAAAGHWRAAAMHLLALRSRGMDRDTFDGESQPVLRFAVEVFAESGHPQEVLETIDEMDRRFPSAGAARSEREGDACILRAREVPEGPARQTLIARAARSFESLGQAQPEVAAWPLRRAEVAVFQRAWDEAMEWLEKSKRIAKAHPQALYNIAAGSTTASQDQRIAAVLLVQGRTDAWSALVQETLAAHAKAKPFEQARAAWPAVLGELPGSGATESAIVRDALAYAGTGFAADLKNFATANTYALARFREAYLTPDAPTRAAQLQKADETLTEAIALYEATRREPDCREARPGRPKDWMVRTLILAARSADETDAAKKRTLRDEADTLLRATRDSLGQARPPGTTAWRATWNDLDLEVQIKEAERKLGVAPP